MSPFLATKQALHEEATKLGLKINVDEIVFPGGKDPGGWSDQLSYACIIHEGTGIPSEWNFADPFGWWDHLGLRVSVLCGRRVYFEWINGCVSALYRA
jgi:hypothetical protein